MKKSQRYTVESLAKNKTDEKGRIFVSPYGVEDLTEVTVCGAFVDTIRQLYVGKPQASTIATAEAILENGGDSWWLDPSRHASLQTQYAFNKMGKASGYRYMLQNNQEGIIILFGQYHARFNEDTEATHLKIELSPHFIAPRTPVEIQAKLDEIAKYFLQDGFKHQGVAVHLAFDYQGYTLPENLPRHLSTYSRALTTYDGLSTIDLSNFSESVSTYGAHGQEKNYLVGKHQSIQMCLYDKTLESKKSDKIDYMRTEWDAYSFGQYDKNQPVRRVEMRLHHTVVNECAAGQGENWQSFKDVSENLTDLWRYAVQRNRVNCDPKNTHISPFWQLLYEDVQFYQPKKNLNIVRKKKQSVDSIQHNLSAIIGNMISVLARHGFNHNQIFSQIRILHFYPQIMQLYRQKGMNEKDLKEKIRKGVEERLLRGKAA